MKLATFNANSIRTRLPIILSWLEQEAPEILCLQETKVQDRDFPLSDFERAGYRAAFRGQKSYNGVAVISKEPLEEVSLNLYDEGDEQARFISAVFRGIPIVNVYVPQGYAPGTDKFEYKLRWLKDLLSHLKKRYHPDSPLVLAGDFNVALDPIDLFDPEGSKGEAGYHPEEQALMRACFEWGLVDLFRRHHPEGGLYTFWDYRIPNGFKRNMGWRIDYILTTSPLAEKTEKVWIDTGPRGREKPSDHTFLAAEFRL
ncbi:MAG: exodeoxyribonuclease III [Pseudomonadota bacterium]